MSAEMQKQLNDELEKINKLYGSSANNEFPTFNFSGSLFFQQFSLIKFDYLKFEKILEPKLDGIHADKLEAHN